MNWVLAGGGVPRPVPHTRDEVPMKPDMKASVICSLLKGPLALTPAAPLSISHHAVLETCCRALPSNKRTTASWGNAGWLPEPPWPGECWTAGVDVMGVVRGFMAGFPLLLLTAAGEDEASCQGHIMLAAGAAEVAVLPETARGTGAGTGTGMGPGAGIVTGIGMGRSTCLPGCTAGASDSTGMGMGNSTGTGSSSHCTWHTGSVPVLDASAPPMAMGTGRYTVCWFC
mmetsp:Transcript_20256/g.44228  ORF Transcript_20256/g.44228 Transcript_20256/m.44228 type:complete len:228 (-) Transcript_20256:931-1614(-)